jgi:hypothetical protein
MKRVILSIVLILSGCNGAHDTGTCDTYLYEGTLDSDGVITLDLNVSLDDPLILAGVALVDHGTYLTWESISIEIDEQGNVHAWSHGGADAPYRLTLMECVK